MKALTLWAEWAHAICWLGKRIENRTRRPPTAMLGERFAIHAGAHIGGRKGGVAAGEAHQNLTHAARENGIELAWNWAHWPYLSPLVAPVGTVLQPIQTRAIVATAVLQGWDDEDGRAEAEDLGLRRPGWGVPGAVWWYLTDVERLVVPVTVERGQLGFWTLPEDVEQAVLGGTTP